jgi:hypothetical protein
MISFERMSGSGHPPILESVNHIYLNNEVDDERKLDAEVLNAVAIHCF